MPRTREQSREYMRAYRARKRAEATAQASKRERDRRYRSRRKAEAGAAPEPSAWAESNLELVSEGRAWASPKYQRDWLAVICREGAPHVLAMQKGSQIGYSVALTAAVAYLVSERRLRVALLLPTASSADGWRKQRLLPLTDGGCRPLAAKVAALSHDRRRGRHLVFDDGSSLKVAAVKSPVELRGWSADVCFLDEVDGYADLPEGNVCALAIRGTRAAAPDRRKVVFGSTPTEQGTSLIVDEATRCAATFRYWIPCPSCGHMAVLDWASLAWPEEGSPAERAAAVHRPCPSCEAPMTWDQLPEALEGGRWQDEAGRWIDPVGSLRQDGKDRPVDWPASAAFMLDAAVSAWTPWEASVRQWLDAQGREDRIRAATNQLKGEPFKAASAEVEPEDVTRFDDLPGAAEAVTAGVDVGQDNIHVGIVAHNRKGRSWLLERRIFTGAVDDIRAGSAWAELSVWWRTGPTWPRPEGDPLPLAYMFVDSGYVTSAVYDFCRQHRRIEPIKGIGGWGHPPYRKSEALSARGRPVRLLNLGVDALKLRAIRGLSSGRIMVHSSFTADDLDEATGERLVWRRRPGKRPVRVWEQVAQRQRVELLDCLVYAIAACDFLNPYWRGQDRRRPERPRATGVHVDPEGRRNYLKNIRPVAHPLIRPDLDRRWNVTEADL